MPTRKRTKEGAQDGWYKATEAIGEDEPTFGAPACSASPYSGRYVNGAMRETRDSIGTQERWTASYDAKDSEFEEENEHGTDDSGFGDTAGMAEGMNGEPTLGWTNHVDQTKAVMREEGWFVTEGEVEPDLGWTGHDRGCTDNEPRDDREGDDERDDDGGESDFPGFIWGGGEGGGRVSQSDGYASRREALRDHQYAPDGPVLIPTGPAAPVAGPSHNRSTGVNNAGAAIVRANLDHWTRLFQRENV